MKRRCWGHLMASFFFISSKLSSSSSTSSLEASGRTEIPKREMGWQEWQRGQRNLRCHNCLERYFLEANVLDSNLWDDPVYFRICPKVSFDVWWGLCYLPSGLRGGCLKEDEEERPRTLSALLRTASTWTEISSHQVFKRPDFWQSWQIMWAHNSCLDVWIWSSDGRVFDIFEWTI